MPLRHRANLVALSWLTAVSLQAQTTAISRWSFGGSAGIASGTELGRGPTRSLDVRHQLVRVPWLSIRGAITSGSFTNGALQSDARVLFGNDYVLFGDYVANASTTALLIGPEAGISRGPVRLFLNTLVGTTGFTSRAAHTRNWRPAGGRDPGFSLEFERPLPYNTIQGRVATTALGAGGELRIFSKLRIDAGVRYTTTRGAPWLEVDQPEPEGDVLFAGRRYRYRRGLNGVGYTIGLHITP
jgi:hypothetical protein